MADRPILFSPPMITALLREIDLPGTGKTQTRRALNPQPRGRPWFWEGDEVDPDPQWFDGWEEGCDAHGAPEREVNKPLQGLLCAPGDRLWCREEHFQLGHWEIDPGKLTKGGRAKWRFVPDRPEVVLVPQAEYRSARHAHDPATPAWHKRLRRFMFRKHSRLTLYVTDVKVERLQDISEADAWAEGCQRGLRDDAGGFFPAEEAHSSGKGFVGWDCAGDWYADLWETINGPGAWDANPWVVAYSFVPRLGNIDTLPATLQEAA